MNEPDYLAGASTRRTLRSTIMHALRSATSDSVSIDAPPATVWAVYTAVASWPEMTASVTSAVLEPPGPLALGSRAAIKQPRLPRVVWTVTELTPERSWTWENHAPLAHTVAVHRLTPGPDATTVVDMSIDQRGVVGRPVGWLARRITRRYLRLEGEGLRRVSEAAATGTARGS